MTWKALRSRMGVEERSAAGDFITRLAPFAVGVLVGAGLGLAFAPRRGEELRLALNEAWKKRRRGEQDRQKDLGGEGVIIPR
jgi:gas vesicle protein